MAVEQFFGLITALSFAVLLSSCKCFEHHECNRQPLGTKTVPLLPDNRFKIEILELDEKYIPHKQYTIRLSSTNKKSTFIAFTIFIEGQTTVNEKNKFKKVELNAGLIEPVPGSVDAIVPDFCTNTIIQQSITPKTSVDTIWTAPPKDNRCVTIRAMIAIRQDVWYNSEGPLTKVVCEDRRKADDMQPLESAKCTVCEQARYKLTFQGMWSFNTHTRMYPNTTGVAKFSDIVGASHTSSYSVFKLNLEASKGLKMLAEQGNTTQLEMHIREELGKDVRTIIKATGPPKTNMATTTTFRVSPEHHLVSLVSAIIPSPDWFLGVSSLELCSSGSWSKNVRLNLYPMDAGTDSGSTFESPNEETLPAKPVATADIAKDVPKEEQKPFARIHFDLMRTYLSPNCIEEQETTTTEMPSVVEDITPRAADTSYNPPSVDVGSSEECPISNWEEWLPCVGDCSNGKLTGYKTRQRYHMRNGKAIGKYGDVTGGEDASDYCKEHNEISETEECEEPCEEEEITPESRVWNDRWRMWG